jgi:hypothetical protein
MQLQRLPITAVVKTNLQTAIDFRGRSGADGRCLDAKTFTVHPQGVDVTAATASLWVEMWATRLWITVISLDPQKELEKAMQQREREVEEDRRTASPVTASFDLSLSTGQLICNPVGP